MRRYVCLLVTWCQRHRLVSLAGCGSTGWCMYRAALFIVCIRRQSQYIVAGRAKQATSSVELVNFVMDNLFLFQGIATT